MIIIHIYYIYGRIYKYKHKHKYREKREMIIKYNKYLYITNGYLVFIIIYIYPIFSININYY